MGENLKYKRILLKLSGEALLGEQQFGIDQNPLEMIANEVKQAYDAGAEVAIVVGGGNIFRGVKNSAKYGMDQATGDYIGMLATVMNALALQSALRKLDALKIKMPDMVPPGVAKAFEVTIPTFIALMIVSTVGWLSTTVLGLPINDLISTYVQEPLKAIIGSNIVAVMILYVIIMLFWCVGIHGNNILLKIILDRQRSILYHIYRVNKRRI